MEEGVFGLSKKQKYYIYLTLLMPCLLPFIIMQIYKDGLFTLTITQLAYLILPYIYVKYVSKEKEIQIFFLGEFNNRLQQIKYGITLAITLFLIIIFYYILLYEFKVIQKQLQVPLKISFFYLLSFSIVFVCVNPVMEELFWRLFLEKMFKDDKKYIVHIFYTIFHFIALCQFMSWTLSILFATTFYSIARTFSYVMHNKGLLASIIGHISLAFGSLFAILDILYIEWEHQMDVIHQSSRP
ncbi:hypothetical protein IMG5_197320 [Ichthyophthirius multifiliis]|uniref:CAAX prenyl protease 2/Lysostaphin resistance protein A-like domain-containing protein n=1 Tax=Ichthyophthirius multifiliis TaxID=5932 RepID=G0R5A2_ICHMU|nr:hypothetical protein IMG5_197320 [Ichthyophthirius multifiliis]EGR27347.1 hypothetical protein IMG5_197320 [Ichthyophthirius multifiliis]|eukprot:XP_004024231.1 hypothetical protein IMG5_197320 [Ichthyophthirius multifiliis]